SSAAKPPPRSCKKDSDCGTGQLCLNGTCCTCTCGGGGSGCTTPADCPQAEPGSCQTAVCVSGVCGFAVDSNNLPACGTCTTRTCSGGTPGCANSAVGTACNSGGGTVCDGAGHCVQCVSASDCPGTDTICQHRTCTAGTCGTAFAPTTTVCSPAGHCDG